MTTIHWFRGSVSRTLHQLGSRQLPLWILHSRLRSLRSRLPLRVRVRVNQTLLARVGNPSPPARVSHRLVRSKNSLLERQWWPLRRSLTRSAITTSLPINTLPNGTNGPTRWTLSTASAVGQRGL